MIQFHHITFPHFPYMFRPGLTFKFSSYKHSFFYTACSNKSGSFSLHRFSINTSWWNTLATLIPKSLFGDTICMIFRLRVAYHERNALFTGIQAYIFLSYLQKKMLGGERGPQTTDRGPLTMDDRPMTAGLGLSLRIKN